MNTNIIVDKNDKIIKAVELGLKLNIPVMIEGPKGTGKTTIVKYVAEQESRKYIDFACTENTSIGDLVGEVRVKNGETYIKETPLSKAVKEGYVICLDEFNMPYADILTILNPLLDDRRELHIPGEEGNKAILKAHKDFRMIVTLNPHGDGQYMGTKQLSEAMIDRFGIKVISEYPSVEKEIKILEMRSKLTKKDNTINESKDGILRRICLIAKEVRNNKELEFILSTRNLIDWVKLIPEMPIKEAYEFSFRNKIDKEEVEIIDGIVGKYFTKNDIWKQK